MDRARVTHPSPGHGWCVILCDAVYYREETKDGSGLLMAILLPAREWLPSMCRQSSLTQSAERPRQAIYADRIWYDSFIFGSAHR
jgi:hypothetical protein